MKLCTIGYTKKSLRRFVELLKENGVDAILDVRLHNTSQLAGFSKKDDLAFILETFNIAYHHLPVLGPSEALLKTYKSGKDWSGYEIAYKALLSERDGLTLAAAVASRYQTPCLLCAEDKPNRCHRRLLAESLSAHLGGLTLTHLI